MASVAVVKKGLSSLVKRLRNGEITNKRFRELLAKLKKRIKTRRLRKKPIVTERQASDKSARQRFFEQHGEDG